MSCTRASPCSQKNVIYRENPRHPVRLFLLNNNLIIVRKAVFSYHIWCDCIIVRTAVFLHHIWCECIIVRKAVFLYHIWYDCIIVRTAVFLHHIWCDCIIVRKAVPACTEIKLHISQTRNVLKTFGTGPAFVEVPKLRYTFKWISCWKS